MGLILTKLGIENQRLKAIIFCSYDRAWFDLDVFNGKIKFCNLGFYGKVTVKDSFEIIASCVTEVSL